MNAPHSSVRESALLLLMLSACGLLAGLQYRWTGQSARAELARASENVVPASLQVASVFDAELTTACHALRPTVQAISTQGRDTVHAELFHEWKSSGARPIFRRVGVAVPNDREVVLYAQDLTDGTLRAIDWPSEWEALRRNLEEKLADRRGPLELFSDPSGLLMEFPVMSGPPHELEWVIFEIDRDYAAKTWLPELILRYLPYSGQNLFSAKVDTPDGILCQINPSITEREGGVVDTNFNRQGRRDDGHGPKARPSVWTLRVWENPEGVAKLVTQRRWRQFGLAAGLCVVLALAAVFLLRQARRARSFAQSQLDFVAAVSHELRTPLTVITGAAHNLQRGIVQGPDRLQEYYGRIIHHAEDLNGLVEQVLAFAGVTQGSSSATQSVDVCRVIDQALSDLDSEIRAAGCTVQTNLQEQLPRIAGDASALTRAVRNLLSNAVKHGGPGGTIGVGAEFKQVGGSGSSVGEIAIEISDRGRGIRNDERDLVFHPFYRGSTAVAEQTRGSGLGLSLVKEIARSHGGSIRLACPPGGGSIFLLTLPVRSKAPDSPSSA